MLQKNFTPKKYWNKYEVFDKVTFLTLARFYGLTSYFTP